MTDPLALLGWNNPNFLISHNFCHFPYFTIWVFVEFHYYRSMQCDHWNYGYFVVLHKNYGAVHKLCYALFTTFWPPTYLWLCFCNDFTKHLLNKICNGYILLTTHPPQRHKVICEQPLDKDEKFEMGSGDKFRWLFFSLEWDIDEDAKSEISGPNGL